MAEATSARRYFFVVGWTKGMALPAYIDGPFLSFADAKHASIDWMFSNRADAYSVMETVPQEAWPDAIAKAAA